MKVNSLPKNYVNSVTLASLAAYYMLQGGIMSRLLPKSLYKRYCFAKASICSTDKSRLLILPYLEICITPRCSLKCLNCANLMQYYESPKDYDADRIFETLDHLLACVDLIDCFRILGGEPFMHKDIAHIISYCAEQAKIVQVQVVTNGTIVPKEEVLKALAHANASVYISDYGTVSGSMASLEKCLSEHGIVYFSDSNYIWDDMGGLERRDYTPERVRSIYQGCRDFCKTLVDGVVYVCPRSAHGDKLGIIPVNDHDHVDIFAGTVDEIRLKLRALYDIEYIEACHYCNAVEDRGKIVAGEQCSAALTKRGITNAG